ALEALELGLTHLEGGGQVLTQPLRAGRREELAPVLLEGEEGRQQLGVEGGASSLPLLREVGVGRVPVRVVLGREPRQRLVHPRAPIGRWRRGGGRICKTRARPSISAIVRSVPRKNN